MYSFIHSFKKKIYLNILKTIPFDNFLPETNKQNKKIQRRKHIIDALILALTCRQHNPPTNSSISSSSLPSSCLPTPFYCGRPLTSLPFYAEMHA